MDLQQPRKGGGDGGVQVAAQREGMGDARAQGDDRKQRDGGGVGKQQRHHQQATQHRARHPGVTPLQGLRQVAPHHHNDGRQYPVLMGGPRQVPGDQVAGAYRQGGAQRIAQCGRAPAQLPQQRCPGPAGGADEQLPLGAHCRQLGRGLAARQVGEVHGFVADVPNAVGHAAQQGGGIWGADGQGLGRGIRSGVGAGLNVEAGRQGLGQTAAQCRDG